MNNRKNVLLLFITSFFLFYSCGEEVLTQGSQETTFTSSNIQTFEANTCSQMHFDKPPVDILYVVDNSGSTLASSFDSIKGQIQNTINDISNEFDYHIYFAPLNPGPNDNIQTYPVMMSDPPTNVANLNLVTPSTLEFFAQASGNNIENGFQRSLDLLNSNKTNGIFRSNANTIIVMISNGDDTQGVKTIGGNQVPDPDDSYGTHLESFKKISKLHASSTFNAESVRFISLVAHSDCNGWKTGTNYQNMSKDLYNYQSFTDNGSDTTKDSEDLCSGQYASLFAAVNNSIRGVVVGHQYDHWKISSQSSSSIQEDDITLYKVSSSGATQTIPQSTSNGFEYIGAQTNKNTRYAPTAGEPATGLMVKLNGDARVNFPDCIIAKTKSPTEYFGYVALAKDPDLTTVKIEIDGVSYSQSTSNGWSYIGYRDVQNVKVAGPTNVSITPEINKSGFILKLYGNAIFTNGQTIKVFYKAKSL